MSNTKYSESSTAQDGKHTEGSKKKGTSDLITGVGMFIAFILFMAMWMYFNT
ncbi:MAG: hypothetical protein LJE83_04580 [Gammaproteobacteria bacterium]|nr:hypothetical protein [Gammaproteobacteria bacterium]